jgi:hypothetical protein
MAIELNHTIVGATDQLVSARFLAGILSPGRRRGRRAIHPGTAG